MEEKKEYFRNIINQILEKTNITTEEIDTRINEVMDTYGFDNRLTALLVITGEIEKKENVKIKLKIEGNYTETPYKEKESFEVEKLEEDSPKPTYEITVPETQNSQEGLLMPKDHRLVRYPSEAEVLFIIKRHRFVKEKLLDTNDVMLIKNEKFVKKSGWRKFINAFGISIELISQKVYTEGNDYIAEYRVKAIAPNGQFVVSEGTKSKSEYWSEKYQNYGSYTLHNLKATARTRAINIAVSDLVGYGAASAEGLLGKEDI